MELVRSQVLALRLVLSLYEILFLAERRRYPRHPITGRVQLAFEAGS